MKLSPFEKVLVAIIGVLLVFTVFFSIIRNSNVIDSVDNDVFSLSSIIKNALIEKPYETVFGWVRDVAGYKDIRDENDRLRKEIDSTNLYKSELMEALREIKELQDILDLKSTMTDFKLIDATVIGRDLSTYSSLIEIDVGEKDGIDENYAVITPKGLIGRIYKVYDSHSIVKLVTAEDGMNKVSVKIQISAEKTVSGYLETYDVEKGCFIIKLLSTGQTVTPNMSVLTSGLGGVFPSGLLVGTVTEVSELNNAVGMNIYVSPAADFDNFNYVSVVKMISEE